MRRRASHVRSQVAPGAADWTYLIKYKIRKELMIQKKLPDIACLVCSKLFTPTRPWQKFCGDSCRTYGSLEERKTEHVCHYCGLLADTIDHIPPRSVRQTLIDLGLASRYSFIEVRCCHECNSALGARPLWTPRQRKEFIKEWITRRYKKYLNIPDWEDSELGKLGDNLRDATLHGLAVRDLIRFRLKY
jgi:hypothetical protein